MMSYPFVLQDKQEVVIEKIVRNKRKCVTVVKGLELFGKCCFHKQLNDCLQTELKPVR